MPTTPKTDPAVEAEATELDRLRQENARLRAELAEARANEKARPNTHPDPQEPSFGLSEGSRADLEQTGTAVSPFTGKALTAEEAGVKRARRTDEVDGTDRRNR